MGFVINEGLKFYNGKAVIFVMGDGSEDVSNIELFIIL